MTVGNLDNAIANHPFRPGGVKIGGELWRQLFAAGRIKWKRGYIKGVIDSGVDLPVLDEDIFVHVDPEFDELDFELPSQPKR